MENNTQTSEIQKEILKKTAERNDIIRHGKLEFDVNSIKSENNEDNFYFNFLSTGPRVEIYGTSESIYNIRFFNKITGELIREFTDVKSGEFVNAEPEYYIPWVIQIEKHLNGEIDTKNYTIDLEGKNVFIAYESSAIGDTIAWMPVIEEFRKIHKCNVIVSSFHNDLFKEVYPNILFIERGTPIQGMQFKYSLGWFGSGHASFRNPYDCHTRNLQQIAMDILGMDYEKIGELRPQLILSKNKRKIKEKYVTITTCSTAQFKYWNHGGGWQKIVDYLTVKGYKVVNIGKQPNILNGVINMTGELSMDDLTNVIQNAEFFCGLPSGLSWLSWALGKKTVLISGISQPWCEFQIDQYRVQNNIPSVCNGCFNDPKHTFDKGEWLFCVHNRNTSKIFECTKTITPDMVKKQIALVEKHIKLKITGILDKDGNTIEKN